MADGAGASACREGAMIGRNSLKSAPTALGATTLQACRPTAPHKYKTRPCVAVSRPWEQSFCQCGSQAGRRTSRRQPFGRHSRGWCLACSERQCLSARSLPGGVQSPQGLDLQISWRSDALSGKLPGLVPRSRARPNRWPQTPRLACNDVR